MHQLPIYKKLLGLNVSVDKSISIRSVTYLFVKLYEGWLEQGSIILTSMVGVLGMTQTFAHLVLWLQKVSLNLSRKSVEWYNDVSGVSNLLQLDV